MHTAAQALASAMVSAGCFPEVSTDIITATRSEYTVIEGCQRFDESLSDGSGSTDGSTAEGVWPLPLPPLPLPPLPCTSRTHPTVPWFPCSIRAAAVIL